MNQSRIGDISDLPPELVKQLRLDKSLSTSEMIMSSIVDLDGTATLDEIIVQIWRRYKVVKKRSSMHTYLAELVKAGDINRIAKSTYRAVAQ